MTYCVGAYSTLLSRLLGTDDAVRRYQRDVGNGDLEGDVADVVDFALAVLDEPAAVSDADFEHLRRSRDVADKTFVELVYVVNVVSGYNRLTLAVDLDYDHEFPEEWARETASAVTSRGPRDDR